MFGLRHLKPLLWKGLLIYKSKAMIGILVDTMHLHHCIITDLLWMNKDNINCYLFIPQTIISPSDIRNCFFYLEYYSYALLFLCLFSLEQKMKEIDLCTPIDKQTLCVCDFISFYLEYL